MEFVKMQGVGNDFIIIEEFFVDSFNMNYSRLARILCDRHFGIGADGLVICSTNNEVGYKMRIFNPDGTEAEMCGNAIRCLGRYLRDRKSPENSFLEIATQSGSRKLQLNKDDTITVNMGKPELASDKIPVEGENRNVINEELKTDIDIYKVTVVSTGPPHAVIFVNELPLDVELAEIAPLIENHSMFPHKINVNFVKVVNESQLQVKVWERGVGLTYACGTGACASLVASVMSNLTENRAVVNLPGGQMFVEWNNQTGIIYMTGPAEYTFTGKINEKIL